MSDLHAWRQGSSTNPTVANRYYVAGMLSDCNGTYAVKPSVLYAMPFISGRAGIVDQIAINVSDAASGGRAQLGIYTVTCAQNFYPQSLMLSGSDADVSVTGLRTITIICSFRPNTMYWFALLSQSSIGISRVRWPYAIYGTDPTTAAFPRPFITQSCAYGLMPLQFPTTVACTQSYSGTPAVAVRYST